VPVNRNVAGTDFGASDGASPLGSAEGEVAGEDGTEGLDEAVAEDPGEAAEGDVSGVA